MLELLVVLCVPCLFSVEFDMVDQLGCFVQSLHLFEFIRHDAFLAFLGKLGQLSEEAIVHLRFREEFVYLELDILLDLGLGLEGDPCFFI